MSEIGTELLIFTIINIPFIILNWGVTFAYLQRRDLPQLPIDPKATRPHMMIATAVAIMGLAATLFLILTCRSKLSGIKFLPGERSGKWLEANEYAIKIKRIRDRENSECEGNIVGIW